MQPKDKSISVIFLKALLKRLHDKNIDVGRFLKQHNLSESLIDDYDSRVTLSTYRNLYHQAAKLLDDDLIGFKVGKSMEPRFLGVLGYAMITAKNLKDAMTLHLRFNNIVGTYAASEISSSQDHIDITYKDNVDNYSQIISEKSITSWVAFGRLVIGREYSPEKIKFRFSDNGYKKTYENYFNCQIEFDAVASTIRIKEKLLGLPNKGFDPISYKTLHHKVRQYSDELSSKALFFKQIDTWIFKELKYGEPKLSNLAESIEMTQNETQRKLKKYGFSFTSYLEMIRKQMAIFYMCTDKLSICETAFSLGFSEQSSFTRAFKRWYGLSPSSYLSRHKESN